MHQSACDLVALFFFDSEGTTFLALLDMYLMVFVNICSNLIIIWGQLWHSLCGTPEFEVIATRET